MAQSVKTRQKLTQTGQFGRFKIERLLGEGGFASVYLALDPKLNRHVALKVPKPSMLESRDAKARFEREARAAAMLSHPSIVAVFECGEQEGQNYIASAYCPGQTLGSWIRRQPKEIELRTAASIIAEIAEAVGYAHQRGIVHRDLKPANILIDGEHDINSANTTEIADCETETIVPSTRREDRAIANNDTETILPGQSDTVPGTRVDAPHRISDSGIVDIRNIFGKLRITDFGLAKSTSDKQELTVEGAIMGTPSYMSPEQASGSPDVGAASDIFTLGTMLFELVAGNVPFRRESTMNTLVAITDDPLPSIGSLRKSVPKDIEAICQKCLEKDPARRYATAFDLAADLNDWLEGRPIKARVSSPFEKFMKRCQRNPGLTTAIGAALFSLALGLAGTTWSWRTSEANLQKANYEFKRAEENFTKATQAAEKERLARNSAEQVALFMTGVFRSPDPAVKGRDVKVIDILEDARQRLDESFGDDPKVRFELMLAIGDCYRQLGEYDNSIVILEDAQEHLVENLANDDYMEVQVRDRLAQAWIETRELEKAIETFEQNLESVEELEGSNTALHRTTSRNLAAAHMYKDDFATAAPILEGILSNEYDTPTAPADVLGIKDMLASCYASLGRRDEAIKSLEEILEQQKDLLGESHPDCLETANNLAVELSHHGEIEKAAEQQKFILEQSRFIHGDEHPITLRCMNNLAKSLARLGNLEDATPLYREVHALCQLKLGEQHINTVSVGQALADTLLKQGEFDEAIPLLETATAPMLKALGHGHGRSMKLFDSLARAHESNDDLPKAIEANKELLKAFEGERSGSVHHHTIQATLVRLLLKNDQSDQAETLASQLYESVSEKEDASDFSKALSRLALGVAKVHARKIDEASEFLERVLSRRDQFPKFSDDEKAVAQKILEILVEELNHVDSESTLFDPAEWESVIEAM